MHNPTVADESRCDREKILLIITAVVNYLFTILGFFIIIPMAVIKTAADGRCLLYADSSNFGPTSVCSYSIAVATLFQVFYSLGRAIIVTLILLDKLKTSPRSPGIIQVIVPLLLNPKFLLPCTIADVIAWLLTLVSACIISRGFDVMCYEVFLPKPERCGEPIYVISTGKVIENYYQALVFTKVSVWVSWGLWILMIAIDVISLRTQGLIPQSALERCGRHGEAPTAEVSRPQEERASSSTPNWFVALKRRFSAKSESSV